VTNAETLKLFKKHFKRWSYMVKHYGWAYTVYYHDCAEDMPEEFQNAGCAAGTTADFKYLHASIHVNLRQCKDSSEHEIEYIVIHELTHLLVCPMPIQIDADNGTIEYTVTTIARIMQGLRND
jgi:hypothetical protein